MSSSGRLTIPVEARRALGLDREAEFDVEVVGGGIVLHPLANEADDAWAYTPEQRELLRHALKDSDEGRVVQMTEAELRALARVE